MERSCRGGVAGFVLQGVARFVCCNADGGYARLGVNIFAEPQRLVTGVVMVGEHAVRGFNFHMAYAPSFQNAPCCFSSVDAGLGRDLGIFFER